LIFFREAKNPQVITILPFFCPIILRFQTLKLKFKPSREDGKMTDFTAKPSRANEF
tara:strand:- start:249 stop:416 length:168 start_codon:yes stop_codon:yes gene_type:complete